MSPWKTVPGFQKLFPTLIGKQHRAAVLHLKVFRLYHPVVDQRQHKAVCHAGAKLFHQVQRQRFPPRTVPVEKAHIGIQPHAFQGAGAVVGQQAVGEGQHGVDPVKGWAAVAPVEEEILFPVQQQVVKYAKIRRRAHALQPPQGFQIGHFQRKRQQFFDSRRRPLYSFALYRVRGNETSRFSACTAPYVCNKYAF